MTAPADTNPLREALEKIASESTQWRWTEKDTADTALAKIAVQMREVATAALASEPVAGTEREALAAALAEHDHKRTQQVMLTEPSWVGQARRALSAPPAPAAEDIGREAEELIANSRPAPAGREAIARIIRCTVYRDGDAVCGFNGELDAADAILALGATVSLPPTGNPVNRETIECILDDFLGVDSPHYEEMRKRCAQRLLDYYVANTTLSPHVLCPTAETISACARSTLIGFRGELGDGNIAFICDQISRKSILDCTPPAPGAADRAEWQPIETAPKDGTPIDLIDMNASNPKPCADRWLDGWLYVYTPTHWMPRPTPPTLPRADRGGAAE